MVFVHTWFQSPDIPLRSCVSVCLCVFVDVYVYFGVGWHISTPIFRGKLKQMKLLLGTKESKKWS